MYCVWIQLNNAVWLFSLQKKTYRSLLESMLVAHVFPEFQNELGYMRARVRGGGGRVCVCVCGGGGGG